MKYYENETGKLSHYMALGASCVQMPVRRLNVRSSVFYGHVGRVTYMVGRVLLANIVHHFLGYTLIRGKTK